MLLPVLVTRRGTFNKTFHTIFKTRAFLDLDLLRPLPPDYMRGISGTGRGALAMFVASHESNFRVPVADCYMMATHRVLGPTPGHASHVRKCPRCNESPGDLSGSGSSSTSPRPRLLSYLGSGRRCSCSWTIFPVVLACVTLLGSMVV
jgi:hypothetical protein